MSSTAVAPTDPRVVALMNLAHTSPPQLLAFSDAPLDVYWLSRAVLGALRAYETDASTVDAETGAQPVVLSQSASLTNLEYAWLRKQPAAGQTRRERVTLNIQVHDTYQHAFAAMATQVGVYMGDPDNEVGEVMQPRLTRGNRTPLGMFALKSKDSFLVMRHNLFMEMKVSYRYPGPGPSQAGAGGSSSSHATSAPSTGHHSFASTASAASTVTPGGGGGGGGGGQRIPNALLERVQQAMKRVDLFVASHAVSPAQVRRPCMAFRRSAGVPRMPDPQVRPWHDLEVAMDEPETLAPRMAFALPGGPDCGVVGGAFSGADMAWVFTVGDCVGGRDTTAPVDVFGAQRYTYFPGHTRLRVTILAPPATPPPAPAPAGQPSGSGSAQSPWAHRSPP